jgi:hypothetical protein
VLVLIDIQQLLVFFFSFVVLHRSLDHLLQVCIQDKISIQIYCLSDKIGFLKDYTKNYKLAFALGGAMIIIAAFFHFSLSCVEPERKEEEEEEIHV